MNNEISMTVSTMTRHGDDKAIYVVFTDGAKSAEFVVPEDRLLKNNGFSEEELASLTDYVVNEHDTIYSIAKKINPMKSFLGME